MKSMHDSITDSAPPADATPEYQALWWLARGGFRTGPEWERAHRICQQAEGNKAHDWIHALVHWIEGDEWNSNYWYRRVGEQRRGATVEEEWQALVRELT